MVRLTKNGIDKMVVSDPTQKLKSLKFQITAAIAASGTNWRSTPNKGKKISVIEVDLPAGGEAGKSVVMEINH
jgi:hypothetical protein